MNVQDLVMTSAPILMRGGLQLDASGNVSTISLSQLRAGEGNEFAVNITPMQGGGYDIRMRGKVFDATLFLGKGKDKKPPAANQSVAQASAQTQNENDAALRDPVSVDAVLERLLLRDGLSFKNTNFAFTFGANAKLVNFRFDGDGPIKGKLSGRFSVANGVRGIDRRGIQGWLRGDQKIWCC